MARRQWWIMPHVLKVSAIKFSPPIAVLIMIKSYDVSFHNLQPNAMLES